ncbi:MAG: hypothetical protein ACFHVJ_01670 [Aestuariibacter sp.]
MSGNFHINLIAKVPFDEWLARTLPKVVQHVYLCFSGDGELMDHIRARHIHLVGYTGEKERLVRYTEENGFAELVQYDCEPESFICSIATEYERSIVILDLRYKTAASIADTIAELGQWLQEKNYRVLVVANGKDLATLSEHIFDVRYNVFVTEDGRIVNVAANYTEAKNRLSPPGRDRRVREKNKKKARRWADRLNTLPMEEQEYILAQLINRDKSSTD